MLNFLARCLLWFAAATAFAAAQTNVLDAQFGASGIAYRPEFGESFQPIGACPHPSGSITVVGSSKNGSVTEVVIARLLPDGSLDTRFSDDGVVQLSSPVVNLSSNIANACSGLATTEPQDDRLTIFVATASELRSLQVDLELGQIASAYCDGLSCTTYFNQIPGFPGANSMYTQLFGLQPGSAGQWLLTGQYRPDGDPIWHGFLLRFSANGQRNGQLVPNVPNSQVLAMANAFEQEGMTRSLSLLQINGAYHLAVLRSDTALTSSAIDAQSAAMASAPALGRGRFIGNQTLVVPVLNSTQSASLAIIKPGQLQLLPLPTDSLTQVSFVAQDYEQALSATASASNGVLISGALQDGEGLGAGLYVARVDLRDNNARIDRDFGSQGAAQLSWQPPSGGCQLGENAHVLNTALVSWQQANLLLAASRTACPWSTDTRFLGMRVLAMPLLADGFE